MKHKLNTLFKIIIILILIFTTSSLAVDNSNTNQNQEISVDTSNTENSQPEEDSNELSLYSESCILVECSTGRTAYEKNSETIKYPASITKVLTAILAVENCNMDDVVTITREMTSKVPLSYTTAYLQPGEQVTVEQLLNVLLIPSANDAGFALAIHISGSVEEFANLMNEKAKELGCTNSNFTNPSGIQDENHYTTAKDMSLIALKAISYPQITDIVCKTSYVLQTSGGNTRTFETTNTLIKPNESNYYEYATGLKTGYTQPAGACLIATAEKENMKFLAVILDAPKPENGIIYRDADCKTLFDYGFENYEEITKVEEPIVPIINDHLTNKNLISNILRIGTIILAILILFTMIKLKGKRKK